MDLTCEERPSDSPLVETIWRSGSEDGGSFISMAGCHWGIVVTRIHGKRILTVRGPETRATPAYSPADAEFFGIQFKTGALMPNFPAGTLMDRRDVNLPEAAGRSFWLDGAAWEFPTFENADTFVNRLVRAGLLIHEPLVESVLDGQPVRGASLRTVQRRFLHATGLRYGLISQIKRARYAVALLKQGVSILDTVSEAGYFDQPHLTRSLKHFVGQTPAQLADQNRITRLSFLYKTAPLTLPYDTDVLQTAKGSHHVEKIVR